MLGNGIGRDTECISNIHKKGKTSQICSVSHCGSGNRKRGRSAVVFCEKMVKCKKEDGNG